MSDKKTVLLFLVPIVLSFILHLHVLHYDVMGYHVWRQSQTQTVIYNFNFSDNSILHPRRFDLSSGTSALLYEFPLYQWLIAQVNDCIGYSVINSRLFSFFTFIFILWGFYKCLRHFVKKEVALLSNGLLCFSPLLYYYCFNPLPDLLALCFAIWSQAYFLKYQQTEKRIYFIFFVFCLMLAALVKLPYLLFGAAFIWHLLKELKQKKIKEILILKMNFLLFMIPVALWYIKAIPTWHNNPVTLGMFNNSKSWLHLLDCFQFTLISSVPELLTNYATCVFLFTGIYLFYKRAKQFSDQQQSVLAGFVAACVYYLFEMNTIEKVHDYYLMPFLPFIFMVVAYGLNYFYQRQSTKLIVLILCLVPLITWLRIDHRWNPDKPGFVKDYLTDQAALQNCIPQKSICIIDPDDSKFIALYYLKRQGFSLNEKELDPDKMKDLYVKGATYLVTENKEFDPAKYPAFLLEEVFHKNLIVFKLTLK